MTAPKVFNTRDDIPLLVIAEAAPSLHAGSAIVELGGHVGRTLARLCREFSPAAYLVAEADPRNLQELRELAKAHGPEQTFIYAPLAIVKKEQCLPPESTRNNPYFSLSGRYVRLKQSARRNRPWTYSSSAHEPTTHLERFPDVTFPDSTVVPAATLEELLDDCCFPERIDLLWMDIEGAERGVLESTPSEVLERVGAINMEAHEDVLHDGSWSRLEALAWLEAHGFQLVALANQDIFAVRKETP